MNITPEQVIIIGFIAAGLGQLLKVWIAMLGIKIDRKWLTVALFAVSILIAYLWAAPILPVFPVMDADPAVIGGAIAGWIGSLISVASVIIGFATLIYNLLLQKVFESLGWTSEKLLDAKSK
jgi:hypothetical protein